VNAVHHPEVIMQKPIVADLDESIVGCARTDSDRFAYTNYFNPLELNFGGSETPILTFYQKDLLQAAVLRRPALAQAAARSEYVNGVLAANRMPALQEAVKALAAAGSVQARQATATSEPATASRLALDLKVFGGDAELRALQASDELVNLVRSEMGYLFLDRTRIRPTGFGLGEHVYALSLAPGEELVLEQKTYSKRQATFEQEDESEQQTDLEMTSTLSTELQEGLEWQNSRTTSSGFQAGGQLGGDIKGVQVGVNLSYSNNATEASTSSRTRSVKDSHTSSTKVAARYRTQHKITFRVSSEQGFESTARRVVRNPNRFTSLTLHYFKIMQMLRLTQERYGVRLCWAPAVKDPGFDLFERIRTGREAILARVSEVLLPPRPLEPQPPDLPPLWGDSGQVEADRWGILCDMSADYDVVISSPKEGYVWDGDRDRVKGSVTVQPENIDRKWGWAVVGDPWTEGGNVKVKVHVGVDYRTWFGGCGHIYIRAGANFNAGPDAGDDAYKAAYRQWQQDMLAWNARVAELREAKLAELRTEADAWEQQMLRAVNPVAELMNRIVQHEFAGETRDEAWEVDFWQQVFDWEAAGYALYPSWWNPHGEVRDPMREPTHFFNASWAKLYVPVRIGFERQALRWIYGKTVDTPFDEATETAFDRLQADLATYRLASFGDEHEAPHGAPGDAVAEQVLTMATWTERLPTDGTHVEVVQSMSSAADDLSRAVAAHEVELAAEDVGLRHELVESAHEDTDLKRRAAELIKGEVDVNVAVATMDGGEHAE
jgi:hypothetical protein